MKKVKKIFALGPRGSNGHQVALQVSKKLDPNAEWQVRFFGTNQEVLDAAISFEGVYAVVPVENTTGGPVATIVENLMRTCARDSHVRVIGEKKLMVEHCCLSRKGRDRNKKPKKVISHPQGIKQCSQFLEKNGWTDIVVETTSTSRAAEMVATLEDEKDSVAIASHLAAREFDLEIDHQSIQNAVVNVTRFAILAPVTEPDLMKKSLNQARVVIVGANGGYGKWLTNFFQKYGCHVSLIDIDTSRDESTSAVSNAEVVLFSLPTLEAPDIIRSFVPASRNSQLWLDITSLKVETVAAMMESMAEVVGMHPLCAPPVLSSLKGQTLTVCPGRISRWGVWFASLLSLLDADIDIVNPDAHDRLVAERQALPHALMFLEAAVMLKRGVDVAKSLEASSPFYRLLLAAVCRMHSHKAETYAGIQIGNPHTLGMLQALWTELGDLIALVARKDMPEFVRRFREHQQHIGFDTLAKGNTEFQHTIDLWTDLSERNSILVRGIGDEPGLLDKIMAIVTSHGVNKTSTHSMPIRGGGHHFLIGLSLPTNSKETLAIIAAINASGFARVVKPK